MLIVKLEGQKHSLSTNIEFTECWSKNLFGLQAKIETSWISRRFTSFKSIKTKVYKKHWNVFGNDLTMIYRLY